MGEDDHVLRMEDGHVLKMLYDFEVTRRMGVHRGHGRSKLRKKV